MKNTSNRVIRLVTATAVAGVVSLASVSGASAATDPDAESYPITTDPVTHPPTDPKPLPATGSDGTEMWLKVGGGAVLAGGLLVAATSRRRNAEPTT